MITLLSLLGSGLVSIFPGIISIFKSWQDTKKEVQLAQIQADLQKVSMETGKALAVLNAETAEATTLLANEASTAGAMTFWDGVRASVRPVITYLFVMLFVTAKITIFWHLVTVRQVDIAVAMTQIWDEAATAILAAIIAFWFGGRQLEKWAAVRRK